MFSRLSVRLPPRPFFLLIALHAQVQPLTQLVEEIGAALALAAFDVRIGVIAMAVLYFQPEYLTEKRSQLLDVVLSVVDTADLVERIDDLHPLDETTRPAERRVRNIGFLRRQRRRLGLEVSKHPTHERQGFADRNCMGRFRLVNLVQTAQFLFDIGEREDKVMPLGWRSAAYGANLFDELVIYRRRYGAGVGSVIDQTEKFVFCKYEEIHSVSVFRVVVLRD